MRLGELTSMVSIVAVGAATSGCGATTTGSMADAVADSASEPATEAGADAISPVDAGSDGTSADAVPSDAPWQSGVAFLTAVEDQANIPDATPGVRLIANFFELSELGPINHDGPCTTYPSGPYRAESTPPAQINATIGSQSYDLQPPISNQYVTFLRTLPNLDLLPGTPIAFSLVPVFAPPFTTMVTMPDSMTLTAPTPMNGTITLSSTADTTVAWTGSPASVEVIFGALTFNVRCNFPGGPLQGTIPAAVVAPLRGRSTTTFDVCASDLTAQTAAEWQVETLACRHAFTAALVIQ